MIGNVCLQHNPAERLIFDYQLGYSGRELHAGIVYSTSAIRGQVQRSSKVQSSVPQDSKLIEAYGGSLKPPVVSLLFWKISHRTLRVSGGPTQLKSAADG